MNPQNVGAMIEKNYGGVRIDGTNATIIGDGDGNFIADRNGIARVWMDHALWPLITTSLYINQTGDIEILKKQVPYFKDAQTMRGTEIDTLWNDAYGNKQRTEDGQVYTGSVLEHILIQQLAAFYDVGVHNIYRLRGADWNDAWIWQQKMVKVLPLPVLMRAISTLLLPYYALWNLQAKPVSRCQRKLKSC